MEAYDNFLLQASWCNTVGHFVKKLVYISIPPPEVAKESVRCRFKGLFPSDNGEGPLESFWSLEIV